MGRPREHGDDTRAALLRVAGELLAGEGVEALTLRRVADEAGTTTRAVYSLFGDKAGLLRALFLQAATTMRRHHEDVPVRDDPVAEIGELALAYRAGALAEPNLYHLFVDRAVPQLRLGPDDVPFAMGSFDRVLHTLRRCAADGLLGGRIPEDVGRSLWAVVHGLASLELAGFLGAPDAAAARWRDTVATLMAGFALP